MTHAQRHKLHKRHLERVARLRRKHLRRIGEGRAKPSRDVQRSLDISACAIATTVTVALLVFAANLAR